MRTLIIGAALTLASGAMAQENYESWRLHTPTFPSTGGNGVIIGEYRPVIVGDSGFGQGASGLNLDDPYIPVGHLRFRGLVDEEAVAMAPRRRAQLRPLPRKSPTFPKAGHLLRFSTYLNPLAVVRLIGPLLIIGAALFRGFHLVT